MSSAGSGVWALGRYWEFSVLSSWILNFPKCMWFISTGQSGANHWGSAAMDSGKVWCTRWGLGRIPFQSQALYQPLALSKSPGRRGADSLCDKAPWSFNPSQQPTGGYQKSIKHWTGFFLPQSVVYLLPKITMGFFFPGKGLWLFRIHLISVSLHPQLSGKFWKK